MRNSPMQNAAYAAWNSFYKSGKAEDYIRYVQLTRRELADVDFTAGDFDAGKDPGTHHSGADGGRERLGRDETDAGCSWYERIQRNL